MSLSVLTLGLALMVVAAVGLLVAYSRSRSRRHSGDRIERTRTEPRKSRLTIASEIAGILGVVLALIALLR